jgi:hypothetical protein
MGTGQVPDYLIFQIIKDHLHRSKLLQVTFVTAPRFGLIKGVFQKGLAVSIITCPVTCSPLERITVNH